MNEGPNAPRNEKEPVNKKDAATNYVTEQLKQAREKKESLESEIRYWTNMTPSKTVPYSAEAVGDGGSDISDAKIEAGLGHQEARDKEYFTSHEVDRSLDNLESEVKDWEAALEDIAANDEGIIEEYSKRAE